MKKEVFKASLLIFTLFLNQTLFAQWGIKGSGHVTKSKRSISGIQNIKVSNGIDLYLSVSDGKEGIEIEADDNLHDIIKTKTNGNQLNIYLSKSVKRAKSLKVHVKVNKITEIVAVAGSDIESENIIRFDKLSISCSSGSDAELELQGKLLQCKLSSGSDMKLSGKVNKLSITAISGSDFDAFNLKAGDVLVNSSSGADVNINVSGELSVRGSSGSDINYKGTPTHFDVELLSGADLNKE